MNASRLALAARMVQRRTMASATPATTSSAIPSIEQTMLKEGLEARAHAKRMWLFCFVVGIANGTRGHPPSRKGEPKTALCVGATYRGGVGCSVAVSFVAAFWFPPFTAA